MYQDTGSVTWASTELSNNRLIGNKNFSWWSEVKPVLAWYSAFSALLLSSQIWKWHSQSYFTRYVRLPVWQSPINNREYLLISSGDLPCRVTERGQKVPVVRRITLPLLTRPGRVREVFLINYKLGSGLFSSSLPPNIFICHNNLYIIQF